MILSIRNLVVLLSATTAMIALSGSAAAQERRPCGPSFIPPALRVFIPQRAGGADLRPACRLHDQCYAGQCGLSREECDCEFLRNMLSQCSSARNPRRCERKAWMYYNLVNKYGESSFRKLDPVTGETDRP